MMGDDPDVAAWVHQARAVQREAAPAVIAQIDRVEARVALDRGDLATSAVLCQRLPASVEAQLLRARLRLLEGEPELTRAVLGGITVPTGMRRLGVNHKLLGALALAEDDLPAGDAVLEEALVAAQPASFVMTVLGEAPRLWTLLNR